MDLSILCVFPPEIGRLDISITFCVMELYQATRAGLMTPTDVSDRVMLATLWPSHITRRLACRNMTFSRVRTRSNNLTVRRGTTFTGAGFTEEDSVFKLRG